MPSLQYWFTSTSLYIAGSFVLSVILGIIGIKSMVSMRWIIALLTISLAIAVLGFWSAARQEQDGAGLRSSINKIASSLDVSGNSVQELADKILARLPAIEWKLSDKERGALNEVLKSYSGPRFKVETRVPTANAAAEMFQGDLVEIFRSNGWEIVDGTDFAIKAGLTGLFIAISRD